MVTVATPVSLSILVRTKSDAAEKYRALLAVAATLRKWRAIGASALVNMFVEEFKY